MQENPNGHFRLDPMEEFCFARDEQLDASRRFRLLCLRSKHAPEALLTGPVPLHDRDITEAMMELLCGPIPLHDRDTPEAMMEVGLKGDLADLFFFL